jgi:hypothetical protein
MKRSNLTFLALITSTLWVGLLGCQHYHLGAPATLSFDSIYIEPIRNESFAPQAQALLNEQLTMAFMEDARIKVAREDDAQALLSIVLTDYQTSVSATEESDTVVGQSFNLTLVARCTLVDTASGEMLLRDVPVSATVDSFVDEGFQQSEYQAIPVLTRNLAKKIRDLTLSGWNTPQLDTLSNQQ